MKIYLPWYGKELNYKRYFYSLNLAKLFKILSTFLDLGNILFLRAKIISEGEILNFRKVRLSCELITMMFFLFGGGQVLKPASVFANQSVASKQIGSLNPSHEFISGPSFSTKTSSTLSKKQLNEIQTDFLELLNEHQKQEGFADSQTQQNINSAAKQILKPLVKYYTQPTSKNLKTVQNTYLKYANNTFNTNNIQNSSQSIGISTNISGSASNIAKNLFTVFLNELKEAESNLLISPNGSTVGTAFKVVNGKITGQIVILSPSKWSVIDQKVTALLQQNHIYGQAVLVSNNNSNSLAIGKATASVDNSDAKVVYPLMSLQKVITGAIFTQLVNDTKGKLNQYQKLSVYYPQIKNADKITIRDLLDHDSGISMSESTPSQVLNEDGALQYTLDNIDVKYDPETRFDYTNANYTLLAGILKKVSGKSYEDLVNQRIFKKLGLSHTFFWDQKPVDYTVAQSYESDGTNDELDPRVPTQNLLSSVLGAGNIYSTPEDYLKIQQGLENGQILSKSDYNYLAFNGHKSINSNGYHGGMYHQAGGIKWIRGALSRTNYEDVILMDEDNSNGVILFTNQHIVPEPSHNLWTISEQIQKIIKTVANE